jgi:hypothetical protein
MLDAFLDRQCGPESSSLVVGSRSGFKRFQGFLRRQFWVRANPDLCQTILCGQADRGEDFLHGTLPAPEFAIHQVLVLVNLSFQGKFSGDRVLAGKN